MAIVVQDARQMGGKGAPRKGAGRAQSLRSRTTNTERTKRRSGGWGRDRTADTAIFSRMLYQLSYPATSEAQMEPGDPGGWQDGFC